MIRPYQLSWFVVGIHAGLFAVMVVQAWREGPRIQQLFHSADPPTSDDPAADLARLVPGMLRQVPTDATITVCNGLIQAFPFELHTVPRPAFFLQRIDPRLLEIKGVDPWLEEKLEWRYGVLEQAQRLTSRRRLWETLRQSDYALLFYDWPVLRMGNDLLDFEQLDLRMNDRREGIGLYRVKEKPQ